MVGLQKGARSRPVLARKPSRSAGRYCIRLSRVFTRAVSCARLRLARLARDLFKWDHTGSDGAELVRTGRELADGQPVPGPGQLGHGGADVGIEIVPDDHDRAGELLMGGIQQPGVVGLGEPFALVLAAAAALVHAVDQPGMLPGLDGDQRGERDALVAAAGHLHHRGGAAPSPGAAPGRP